MCYSSTESYMRKMIIVTRNVSGENSYKIITKKERDIKHEVTDKAMHNYALYSAHTMSGD